MDPCNPPFSETDEMRETLTHDFIDGMSVEDKNEYIRWDGTTPVLNNHTLPDTMMNSLRVQNLVCPECDGYFTWNMWNGHTRTCKMAPSSCKYCGYQQPTYLVGFPHQIGCRGIGGSYHRCETEYWNSSHTPSWGILRHPEASWWGTLTSCVFYITSFINNKYILDNMTQVVT